LRPIATLSRDPRFEESVRTLALRQAVRRREVSHCDGQFVYYVDFSRSCWTTPRKGDALARLEGWRAPAPASPRPAAIERYVVGDWGRAFSIRSSITSHTARTHMKRK
jgi:hypothetical protein